jgi:hypothetical protein
LVRLFSQTLLHNLHLVIVSRSEPAMELAFLRAKSRVTSLQMAAISLRNQPDPTALLANLIRGSALPGRYSSREGAGPAARRDPPNLLEEGQGMARLLVEYLCAQQESGS